MFVSIRATSWQQAKEIFADGKTWAFRGQNDEKWIPESTLYRQVLRTNYPVEFIKNREGVILKEFQRFAHQYISDLPAENAYLDWLALLQHYGAPTRIIDFTHSFYVASFFSIEKADNDSAVWAIDLDALTFFLTKHIAYDKKSFIDDINAKNVLEFNKNFLDSSLPPAVLPVEPKQLHERLWIQQGLFLAPTDPTSSFLDNLASLINVSGAWIESPNEKWSKELKERLVIPAGLGEKYPNPIIVVKLILPKELHFEIISDLQKMNINAATLFPGLDGFARSMFYHLSSNTKHNDFLRNLKKFSQKAEQRKSMSS